MASTYVASPNTSVSETNCWLVCKGREICLTYKYFPYCGSLTYAASIYRKTAADPDYVLTRTDIENHEHTTAQRFAIRPVQTTVDSYFELDELFRKIRQLMCQGPGCKGPRMGKTGDQEDAVSVSSDSSYDEEPEYQVCAATHRLKTVRRLRYIDDERDIFICFKGSKTTGDVLYGAAINQRTAGHDNSLSAEKMDAHYKTALERLNKCPVHTNIPTEFRSQLDRNPYHREDVLFLLADTIYARRQGMLQIRGSRCWGS